MANYCVENDDFFDASNEISSEESDFAPEDSDCAPEDSDCCISDIGQVGNALNNFHYDFWIGNPRSIDERRDEFIRQTGFVLERCLTAREGPAETICEGAEMSEESNAGYSEQFDQLQEEVNKGHDLLWRFQSLDDRGELDVHCPDQGVDTNRCAAIEELQRTFESGNLSQQLVAREPQQKKGTVGMRKQQIKEGWLKKFSFKAASMLGKDRIDNNKLHNDSRVFGSSNQKVRVHSHKKWSKELSSVYEKQDFSAHKGPILAMKFSFDGQYLATGGEDRTLKIWKVTEDDRPTDFDFLCFSPASTSLYFSVNGISNLASFLKIKEEGNMTDKMKKSPDSAHIMIPRKVFRILEKPLHVFHGHEGEILDISWSKKGYLLSSSVDNTVRLWRVGCDNCLRVFPHNDYVTCAQFNPMDDNYFISGSIDGIVRIWEIFNCQVVDWIDFKEIVTAICYQPDGKGGIVGSVAGNCAFFDITDDYFQTRPVIYFQEKKTLTSKRITGFQFSPSNPSEVVVSSANSHVLVLRGPHVICKLRGSLKLKDRRSQIIASFTSDGKHIISATDESNVYVWSHLNNQKNPNAKPKNIWSCESFLSHDALIAVPWHGITSSTEVPPSTARQQSRPKHTLFNDHLDQKSPLLSSDLYSGNNGSSSVSSSRSSAEQPEGVLPTSSPSAVLPTVETIDLEFLRNVCESILTGGHLWGLVIVTGGKDGRIRTYHNYGLPIRYPRGQSLRSSLSFSSFRKRCTDNCGKISPSSFKHSFR